MEETTFKNLEQQVKDLDEKEGIVTIYINSFDNEDSDGDISMQGSFKRTFKNNIHRIKHLLNHDIYQLIGVPIELFEDDFGAIARSQLNMKKELGRDVFEDYRLYAEHGKSLEHSVRVQAVKRDSDDERKVLEWKLWEYSTLYGWGANELTPLIDIKDCVPGYTGMQCTNESLLGDLEMMLRKGNYTENRARQIEEKYNQLKNLLTDPSGTPEKDPSTLDKNKGLMDIFFNQLNMD